ncbi:DMT family transporter [Aquabacterium soli]|nr:DMT family transporter [Aquabacterium soli]
MTSPGTVAGRLSATWLMVLATVLFAGMGVCVKLASSEVTTAEVVFFRGLVGAIMIGALAWRQRLPLRTKVLRQHFWRSVAGVSALSLWFYTIGHLPLATAVTLNYMSSVWMGVFLITLQLWRRWRKVPHRAIAPALLVAVLVGFIGVALVLRPTIQREQWLAGLLGLISGGLSAWAYLQVASLGRSGEPEHRVVFYFSAFGTLAGLALMGIVHLGNEQPWASPSLATWGWLLGIGVFATLAQLAMTRAYALGQPLAMASLQYLGIVHAFVLGVWLFGEPVHLLSIVGTALIVLAGVWASRSASSLR